MPAAFVAVRKFARAALLRGAGLFAALLFAAGFVGGVAGEGLGAGNVAHAQVPDAPTLNAAATPTGETPAQITLGWSAPNNGGSAITAYFLSYGTVSANLPASATASVVSVSFDVAYSFTLRAANAVGASPAAVVTARVFENITNPAPARNLRITRIYADGLGFDFAWDPPEHWGGGGVGSYNLRFLKPGQTGNGSLIGTEGDPSTTRSASFPNYTFNYGETLRFFIWTQNGVAYWTGPSHTLTVVPSAPPAGSAPSVSFATVTALASGTEISVSLSVADGGSSLTGLTLLYGGTAALSLSPSARATVIGGLSANTAYTLSIVAVNAVGAATAVATATTPAQPITNPTPPRNVSVAEMGADYVVFAWDEPASWGGSSLSIYIFWYQRGSDSWSGGLSTSDNRLTLDSDLGAGESYKAHVFARSAANRNSGFLGQLIGNSITPLLSFVFTPPPAATAPSVSFATVTALASGTEISVSLSVADGGSSLTGLTLLYGGTAALTLSPTTRAAVIASLSANTAYTLSVIAVNAAGAATAVATATTPAAATAPSAAQNLSLVSSDARIGLVFSWDAPASWGGSSLSVYRLSLNIASNGWQGYETTDTRITITRYSGSALHLWELSPFFWARVIARSQAGLDSSHVQLNGGAVASSPNAPIVAATALAGGTEISVSWRKANNSANNNNATAYAVHLGTVAATLGGAITATVVGGLQGNTGYTLSVWAINPVGAGAILALTVTTAPPPSAPDAPTVNVATTPTGEAAAAVTLSWSAPANGGSAITAYFLSYGTVSATLAASQTATAIGVSLGVAYVFTLQAANAIGASPAAVVNASIAAAFTKPSGVRNISVEVGNLQFIVSWDEPASWGGSSLQQYRIGWRDSSQNTDVIEGITDTKITLTQHMGSPLVEGSGYNMLILAKSHANLESDAVLYPAAGFLTAVLLSAPSVSFATVTALTSGTEISISLLVDDGGGLSGLTLLYGGTEARSLPPTTRQAVIDSLSKNAAYTLSIIAVNSEGAATAVATATTPATAPNAPANFNAAPTPAGATPAQVTLSWSAPANGGSAITAYFLTYGTVSATLPASASATVVSVSFDVAYSFTLRAANSVGASPAAVAAASIAPPSAPSAPANFNAAATPAGQTLAQVTLSWSAPANNGGSAITAYFLTYGTVSANLQASQSATVIDVSLGVAYSFTLRAANSVGASPAAVASASIVAAPAVGQDAAPDAVVLQAAAGAFSRAFSTPINDRLLAIDGGGNAASAGFMGANFAGAGGAERGIAQLLKRHGNAIANGGNFDSAALRNGSFVMPLGNGGGNGGAGAMGLAKSDILSDLTGIVDRLTDWLGKAGGGAGNMLNNAAVWGGASYRGVENNKNADKWEGNSASYYLGIDSAVGEANENGGVLAGVVFAHNRFKSDYKLANNGGEGEYNVAANSAHPYLLWRSANGKNRAWGSFGFGVGNVERKGAAGDASDRSAKVGGGSAGFRGAVWQRKGVAIDAQADWSFANINIDGGAAARANNLRALLEARGSVAMAGGGFGSPFAQLGYVRQADDANNGAGWEAAAGWRWRGAGGWSGELRGGAASISNGNKEWSAAGVLRKAAANSKGFSMSLRPQYGDAGGSNIAGGGDFWSMPVAKESANPRLGINAKLGYGFTAANALWKPYLSANTAAGASAAYGAGAAWQNLLQSNLALRAAVQAQRQEQATALQLRFTATY